MFGIPLPYYTDIYYNAILLIVLISLIHTNANSGGEKGCYLFNYYGAIGIMILVTLYMGLRPVSGRYFGDMGTYARYFNHLKQGGEFSLTKDIGFEYFVLFSAKLFTEKIFFLLCSVLYIVPIYFAVKRWHPNFTYLALLAVICSFSFWPYGTNGMRAGIATSIFIWGLSYRSVPIKMLVIMLISVLFHKSMLLPLLSFGLTFVVTKPKYFLWFWMLSIVLSVTMGGVWINLFSSLGFGDERFVTYLTSIENQDQFRRSGFRWDFLLYSFIPVAAGYLYIFKYNFQDKLYNQIFSTYLISNAFWIMVIRASFSNRFAYLSWFLMAIVIIYPLLKHKMWKFQYSILGFTILGYFLVSYVLHYLV